MPLNLGADQGPTKFPEPDRLPIVSHKKGVISLIDKSLLSRDALEKADNCFLYENGQAGPRAGLGWYGTDVGAVIEGFDYFDYDGNIHIVVKAGTKIYRSTDDGGNWTECTGASFTSGVWTNFNQNGSFLYITNGVDTPVRYDGTTTLQVYSTLTAPAAPTIVETGSGLTSGTSYNHYYKCARVNKIGFSIASSASTVIQTELPRESWDGTTNYATLTLPALTGDQTRYDIYYSNDDTDYYYIGSTATTKFRDYSANIILPGTKAPTESTAEGPMVEELVNVGSRQYGVRDSDNRYRIWFTGTGALSGSFSTAYDGGYLDWQEGGKYIPVQVADYRDGKGNPYATIWCSSADGTGAILQMSLSTVTVAGISISVPAAYVLPGSRGTPAPGSVVNVLNDYFFYNSQAIYNLGSRAQFLNLLSTDEASANIRPDVRRIRTAAESGIVGIYDNARLYMSVPMNSDTNDTTMVYDTEQKAWLPFAFKRGFKKFLKYTSSDGTRRLLAVKPEDTRLTEISEDIAGDYGEPFETELVTGLYPVNKDRFQFQHTDDAMVELSAPRGKVVVELLGIERRKGFKVIKQRSLNFSQGSGQGHSSRLHSAYYHSDTTGAQKVYSESSTKRYMPIQKQLNAVQWRLYTNTIDASYRTRTLQTSGTLTQDGMPRQWKI